MSTEARVQCGQRLQALRDTLAMSQATLGQKVGKSQAAVARWEAGQREPSLDTRRRLVAILGADPYAIDQPAEKAS